MEHLHSTSHDHVLAALCGLALVAVATAGVAATAVGGGTTPSHRMESAYLDDDPLLHALHRLNLTSDQRARVHTYVEAAAKAQASDNATPVNRLALHNPGDPAHAAAVQAAESLAASRISRGNQLDVEVYNALTPDQQAQLPSILAAMQTAMHGRGGRHEPRVGHARG